MTAISRSALVTLLGNKVITGNNATTAQNIRDFENNVIDSFVNSTDDADVANGYMKISASGIVNVSFIKKTAPTGQFLRDDGTWQPVGSAGTPTLQQVLTAGSTLVGNNLVTGTGDLTFGSLDAGIYESTIKYSGSTILHTAYDGIDTGLFTQTPNDNIFTKKLTVNNFSLFTSSGTPASGEPNYFLSTITVPTGNQYNIRSTYTVNSIANNSAYRIGGILGETYISATNSGALGFAVGTYGYIQNYGSGLITRAIGSYNIVANRSTGNITNVYGGYFKTENDTTGTLTFNAGVFIETPSNSGTITTNHGVYISAQAGVGSSNFALYSAGASDNSYIAGSLTIATSLTSTTVTNTPSLVGTSVNGISYKSTTGNPTATDAAHLFLGGNNGAIEIIRFLNNGNIRIPNARVIQGLDSSGTYRDLFTWSGGDNININGRPGSTDITLNPTSGGSGLVIKSTGDVGVGVGTPQARLNIIKTTEQLRVGYDASNYFRSIVSITGVTTISCAGTDPSIKILDSAAHKLSFWNAAPVVQPTAVTTVQGFYNAMSSIGLIAAGTITLPTGYAKSINNIAINTTGGATGNTDYYYFCTATLTFTLPTAVGNTNTYYIKVTSGTLTIDTTSSQTIDGSLTITTSVANTAFTLISDGTNWQII